MSWLQSVGERSIRRGAVDGLATALAVIACGIAAAEVADAASPAGDAHYAMGVTVAPDQGALAADIVITLGPVSAGEQIEFVLGRDYTVTSATADPAARVLAEPVDSPFPNLQRLAVRFSEAAVAPQIRIRTHGPLGPSGTPPLNMITPRLVELNLDSMWLPVRSDIGLRFTADALISGLPQYSVLVSQGEVTRWGAHWRVTRTVPDFDFPFVAAPGLTRAKDGRFELFAADPDAVKAQLYRRHGAAALEWLEKRLGSMPGSPARIVVVSRERKSGYARRGYLVLTEDGTSSEPGTAKFTAHELAHAWFSNSNPTTEHRWLDESIAEYVSLRYVEHALGSGAREGLVAPKRSRAAAARPILGGLRADAELYDKGPLLLFELEGRLGRETMDLLLRTLAERRIGDTREFLLALTQIAGADVARWFESRLRA